MRSEGAFPPSRVGALALAAFLAAFAGGPDGPAQDPLPVDDPAFHDAAPGRVGISGLSPEKRVRVLRLWGRIVCACPRENWTRTLTGCPDACADPQKEEVLEQVRAGWSDEAILEEQRRRYGAKALAQPELRGTGLWAFLLPFLLLAGAAAGVGTVYARWRSAARRRRAGSRGEPSASEIRAVERELAEVE